MCRSNARRLVNGRRRAAGNMLAKELDYLAAAESAGIVLGASVPIILTSRSDHAHARLASSEGSHASATLCVGPDDRTMAH